MIVSPPAQQRTLFDLPEEQQVIIAHAPSGIPSKAIPRPQLIQRVLWLDIDAPPSPTLRYIPAAAREFRARLRHCFDPGCTMMQPWGERTHELGQQLLPLLRRVSYTQALIDGAFRLFLEYRPCDKTPHYRMLWGHLFWGRADIRIDTDLHGANIRASASLPIIQDRLADYLIALGYRIETAHLRPHEVDLDTDYEGDALYREDVKTDTREYRIFKLDVETERRRTQRKKKILEKELP